MTDLLAVDFIILFIIEAANHLVLVPAANAAVEYVTNSASRPTFWAVLTFWLYSGAQCCLILMEAKSQYQEEVDEPSPKDSTPYLSLWESNDLANQLTPTHLIEFFVLNRYSVFGYRNCVGANRRLVASLMQTIFVFLGLFIIACFPDENVATQVLSKIETWMGIIGFFFASFIVERKSLYDKWIFLAQHQNQLAKLDSIFDRKIAEARLSLDILTMEMWSHRSFKGTFSSALKDACTKGSPGLTIVSNQMKPAIPNSPMTKGLAFKNIQVRLNALIERRDQNFPREAKEIEELQAIS